MISKSWLGAACAAAIMAASSMTSAHADATTPAAARQFLITTIRGDNSEIMLGNVAARHGDSPGVREFGRVLIVDHTMARAQAAALARQMRMHVPTTALPIAIMERQRLAPMSGAQFDREFVRYMIRDHRQDVVEFRKHIALHEGAVSRLALRQLPVIQKHLDMAVALYREPKVAEAQAR